MTSRVLVNLKQIVGKWREKCSERPGGLWKYFLNFFLCLDDVMVFSEPLGGLCGGNSRPPSSIMTSWVFSVPCGWFCVLFLFVFVFRKITWFWMTSYDFQKRVEGFVF